MEEIRASVQIAALAQNFADLFSAALFGSAAVHLD
jgi:hypothetical protein